MGGGKNGKGGGGRFAEQCEGLQGLWSESDRTTKRWIIDGARAFRQTKMGISSGSYQLCEGQDGGLIWGLSGVYKLDPEFMPGMSTVKWFQPSRGKVAFKWEYLGPAPDKEAAEPKGAGKGKGEAKGEPKGKLKGEAKSKPKGEAKGKPKGEAKGEAKGKHQSEGKSKTKPKAAPIIDDEWSTPAWWDIPRAQPQLAKAVERRIDGVDGKAYSWEELKAFYSGPGYGYGVDKIKAWWSSMALYAPSPSPRAQVAAETERRIDIADGQAYSWDELRSWYSAELTKKATEYYWASLDLAPSNGKGKAAAKGKDKDGAKGGSKGAEAKGKGSKGEEAKGKGPIGKAPSKGKGKGG